MGCRSDLVQGQRLHGVVVAIACVCSSSASEAAQISDGGYSTIAYLVYMSRIHAGPTCPVEQFHNRAGMAEAGAFIGCGGQRGLASKAAFEQSCRFLHRQSTGTLSAHGPHLLQHSLSPGQGSWYREKEKHKLKGNRASLGPTHRASALVTWDQTLPPIGWCWPLSRWEDLSHTWCQL